MICFPSEFDSTRDSVILIPGLLHSGNRGGGKNTGRPARKDAVVSKSAMHHLGPGVANQRGSPNQAETTDRILTRPAFTLRFGEFEDRRSNSPKFLSCLWVTVGVLYSTQCLAAPGSRRYRPCLP
jgi:hypothetical protein